MPTCVLYVARGSINVLTDPDECRTPHGARHSVRLKTLLAANVEVRGQQHGPV